MQYEIIIKVIGTGTQTEIIIKVIFILAFLILLLLLLKLVGRRLLQVLVQGLLRWITVYSRTHGQKQGTQ